MVMTKRLKKEEFIPLCRFYVYEGPRPICLKTEIAASKCQECGGEGKIYIGIPLQTPCYAPKCPDCEGTGLSVKPAPGKLCHQFRPDCLAYRPTFAFSCGEAGRMAKIATGKRR